MHMIMNIYIYIYTCIYICTDAPHYKFSRTIIRFPVPHREKHIVDDFSCSQLVAGISNQFHHRYWWAPHMYMYIYILAG